MAVQEIEAGSLHELIEKLTPVSPDPHIGRRRDSGIYRGLPRKQGSLLSSLDRLGGVEPPRSKHDLEEHILRNFIRYSRPYFPYSPANDWEFLVVAQHHGLPTRMLDWTYSPLVAAYFATLDIGTASEPVIWRLDWKRVHRHFKIPELALLTENLGQLSGRQGEFSPWDLFRGDFSGRHFACMVEPPSLDARIVAQSAVFTLCSDKSKSLDEFLAHHGLEDALTRYVLPPASAATFRDQLDLASVDERRLFPGLDGVTAYMRRYYS